MKLSASTAPRRDMILSPIHLLEAGAAALALFIAVPYVRDRYGQRSIPGPFLARFTNLWLAYWAGQGKRSEKVHEQHLKYGRCSIFML